jgi:broad specificity phosphatase PhoE
MVCYVIRHGEIPSNRSSIYPGTRPESLTTRGREQAMVLGERLRNQGIRQIYTSPIKRARETAEILGNAVGAPIHVENDLREMDLGPWEGLSEDQVGREFPREWEIWNRAPATLRLPGREPLQQVQTRALSMIRNLCLRHFGATIAAVTHVSVVRCVVLYAVGKDLNDYRSLTVENASAYGFEAAITNSGRGLRLRHLQTLQDDSDKSF